MLSCMHALLSVQDNLKAFAAAGYTSFDTADIYGPSEGQSRQSTLCAPHVPIHTLVMVHKHAVPNSS
jgi:diketogulonate reductase-like aldo/keto reductase